MTSRIVLEEYEAGYDAFKSGVSLMAVVSQLIANAERADFARDDKDISFVLGYADALVDMLRNNSGGRPLVLGRGDDAAR